MAKQATRKANVSKGQPAVDPGAFKENTVRRGVNGYWWITTKALYAGHPENKGLLWMPLGNHATKNAKTRRVQRMKVALSNEDKIALEKLGNIRVSFNLTTKCEKSGKLPKLCDLEHEAKHLFKPLQKTEWIFSGFDYAVSPKEPYKYVHLFGGPLKRMEEVVALLKKHYAEHTAEGSISKAHILAEEHTEAMKRSWFW